MPFLQVNGYTIPVASVQRSDLLLGGRGRAYDGTPQTQDRGRKQIFKCKTPPLAEQAREAIIGIIRGDGFVWPWDTDLYSHKGVGPATGLDQATQLDYLAGDGDPIVTSHYLLDGLSSNYTPHRNGILSVDPDSTNLFPADARDCEASGDFTAVNGATLGTTATHYVQGTKSVSIDTDAAGADIEGGYVDIDPGAGSATKTYVASFYAKLHDPGSSGEGINARLTDATNAASGDSVDVFPSGGTDEWVRIAVTITIGGVDCRDLRLYIRETAQDSNLTMYVDKMQLEEQDYPTAWVDGARGGVDDLAYDFDFSYSFTDWSAGIWFWGPAVARHPAVDGTIWQAGTVSASTPYVKLWRRNAALDLIRLTIFDGATTVNMDTDASDVDWEAWNFIGVSYRTDPETGETRLTVRRINGSDSETYTDATALVFTLDAVSNFYVGNNVAADHWIGHLGELMLFPFAVPVDVWDGIASTMGQAGDGTAAALPLPQWPRKLVTGDALVAYPIAANARDYGTLFEGDVDSVDMVYGDARNNLGSVAFTLEEA